MKLTVFNAKKTLSKFPASPYDDDTFFFETKDVDTIVDVFDAMTGSFVLNLPLKKNLKAKRNRFLPFQEKIDYMILDIDNIETKSDRELVIQWFKDQDYRVVLGESRTDYRLKGVMRIEPQTPREAKQILLELQGKFPGTVDKTSAGRGSYQAPILKHRILYNGGTKIHPKLNTTEVPSIETNVPDVIQNLCIEEFKKKGYSFIKQTQDGYQCRHPSEVKSPGGFSWNPLYPFSMMHWNQSRKDSVWEEVIKTEEYKKYQKENLKEQIKEIIPRNEPNVNERYLSNYPEKVSSFLDDYDILSIQSPMGTGKSKILEEVIHQSRKRGLKVLFVTNRISLADDISAKYDGIKHYLGTEIDDNYYQHGDDLVVQIDSLHKYSIKFFDVVIMDEAATTLMHLLTLENHQKKIATQVFSLNHRKLVLADAFIFNEMVDIFKGPKTKVINIVNGYRDNIHKILYSQKDNFIKTLVETARKEPVTFSSGSISIIKVTELLLKQAGISFQTISSDTPESLKKAIYRRFQDDEPLAQVVMYSPTLTVGVSNLNKVKHHFHYDAGLSMNVLSSLQMVKRTRSAETLHMYLNERIKYNPTDLHVIQSKLSDFYETDEYGDSIGISKAGEKFSTLISIHNILENRHKVSFMALMSLQFKNGAKKVTEKVPSFVHKLSKVVKKLEMNQKLDVFEVYKNISDEELSEIELKLFGLSKKEQYIKEFNNIKNDETLFKLTEEEKEALIQEEILHPGSVEYLKNNIKNPTWIKKSRNGKINKRQYKSEIKEYGFKKQGVVWELSPVLFNILRSIL